MIGKRLSLRLGEERPVTDVKEAQWRLNMVFSDSQTKNTNKPKGSLRKIRTARNLKGKVYQMIKKGIIEGSLPSGMQLKEMDLEKKLGVSRTPIREALNQLYKDGMVDIVPRKGAFVREWTEKEVIDTLILHEVLEGLAARLATDHLQGKGIEILESLVQEYEGNSLNYAEFDERFHQEIIQACNNERLINLMKSLEDDLQMHNVRRVIFASPNRIKLSLKEHRRALAALKEGDGELAEKLMREHFRSTRVSYVESTRKLRSIG